MENLNNVLQFVREDDFVEYYLFSKIDKNQDKDEERFFNSILAKANKIVGKCTQDYLWHKDSFKLTVRTSCSNVLAHIDGKEENLPPHLYGVSHYGDNIEDEWFIVYILQELTKEIPGSIAKVYDSDGEFLLIEAADFLPYWANPETCENRVYIHDGNIHLLPPENIETPEISVQKAINQIWSDPGVTLASQDIQNSIRNKLTLYPDNVKNTFHHATVYVPTSIAAILKDRPNLISVAVQAFCNRDSVDMKACRAMKFFPPEQRVKTRVKFTKCLYAMLLHSKYIPDRKIGWNLPQVNSKEYKAHILGVKIACGFEILVAQAKPSKDIEGDRGWEQYLRSLKERAYFRDLLEGSREYNNLLNKAKEYYINHRDSMQYSPAIGQDILSLLRALDFNFEDLQKEEQTLIQDDDESWLDISPDELDKMLQEKYGQKKFFKANESTDAGSFADKVNHFLNHVSDVQGVEFPADREINGDSSPKRPPRSKKNKNSVGKKGVSFSHDILKGKNGETNNKINFDPNSFTCAIQNILSFVIPEDNSWDLESDSEMDEYENDNFVKQTEMADKNENGNKNKMEQYMEKMDIELASTTIGQSFEKRKTGKDVKSMADSNFEDIESFEPVDIDMNALKNILESYRSQLGEAGPSSNMLGPMGVHLDPK